MAARGTKKTKGHTNLFGRGSGPGEKGDRSRGGRHKKPKNKKRGSTAWKWPPQKKKKKQGKEKSKEYSE